MSTFLLDKIDLDDVLAKFSIYGCYHSLTAFWIILGIGLHIISSANFIFIAEEIEYSCATNISYNDVSKVSNLTNAENKTGWCRDSVPCAEWIYANPESFVAELACQDWKRNLVGTVHSFGFMIGSLIVGVLSDRYGRRTLAIATGITVAVCGLAKSFTSLYWIYITFELLEGLLGDTFSPLYMLALEMVATKSRPIYVTICSLGLVVGGIVYPWIRWLVPYWRTFLKVIYAPGLLFILLIYLIDESPRWLLTKGNINATVKNIKKAAKLNKIEIKENLTMLSFEIDTSSNFMAAVANTFKSRALLRRLFVCIIWWTACTFVDNGLIIDSVFLDGNKYTNFALVSTVRFPAVIFTAYIMTKFNRRGPLILSFVACAVLCVSQPFISHDTLWLVITIYMASKVTSAMFYKITYIFTAELFPTYTRNSMQALCLCVGGIGGVVATQMPLLMAYWSGLPIVLFGATSLIAALVTLLVPDTGKTALPDTVRQAEALGTRILIKEGRAASHRTRNDSARFD